MRQFVGEKKLRKLRKQTGLPILKALVRGGTGHRIDLYLEDGRDFHLWPNGELAAREDDDDRGIIIWRTDQPSEADQVAEVFDNRTNRLAVWDGSAWRTLAGVMLPGVTHWRALQVV